MAREYELVVGAAEAGQRLDQYLSRRLPETLSRTAIQRAIEAGQVTVNGAASKSGAKLRAEDRVRAFFEQLPPKPSDIPLTPQDIPLPLAFEDEDLLVVDKPAGLVTHPAPGHWDGTLVNAVLWHLKSPDTDGKSQAAGAPDSADEEREDEDAELPRAGIVHRLDKDTSGLLIIAKTERALLSLSQQMKQRSIHRGYLAVLEGQPPADEGTVDAAIGRHPVNRKLMTIRHLGGRRAVTHYRVLQRSSPPSLRKARLSAAAAPSGMADAPFAFSVLELSLDTGRTHQIRVHMAHLGHPVVGDTVYGRHAAAFWETHGVSRQLLHAWKLSFRHPASDLPMHLYAQIPEEVSRWCSAPLLDRLRSASDRPSSQGRGGSL